MGLSRQWNKTKGHAKKAQPYVLPFSGGGVGDNQSYQDYVAGLESAKSRGMAAGEKKAEDIYGMKPEETGEMIQDIVARRKKALSGDSAMTDEIARARGMQTARLQEQGGGKRQTERKKSQVERQAATEMGAAQYQSKQAAMESYQQLVGKMASAQGMLPMMYGQLYTAGMQPAPQQGLATSLLGGLI